MDRFHPDRWINFIVDLLGDLERNILHILLHVFAFPYYAALRSNTLDVVEKINKENNRTAQDKLVKRFVQSRINESKYVQVAVSKAFLLMESFSQRVQVQLHC